MDVKRVTERLVALIAQDPRRLWEIESRQFEELVAELLEDQGYEVTLTPPSSDGGRDLFAARKDTLGSFLYLVECKQYSPERAVGVEVVRSLYGIVSAENATAGIVATTSRFTKGAIRPGAALGEETVRLSKPGENGGYRDHVFFRRRNVVVQVGSTSDDGDHTTQIEQLAALCASVLRRVVPASDGPR